MRVACTPSGMLNVLSSASRGTLGMSRPLNTRGQKEINYQGLILFTSPANTSFRHSWLGF